MKALIAAVHFVAALLLAWSLFAAEPTPDPRLAQIHQQRVQVAEKIGRAKIIFDAIRVIEEGEAELRKLTEEENKIKAEKPQEEKPKGK